VQEDQGEDQGVSQLDLVLSRSNKAQESTSRRIKEDQRVSQLDFQLIHG